MKGHYQVLIDLTGKKFGKLTVLKRGPNKKSKSRSFAVRWECKCDCGKNFLAWSTYLRNGKATNCGCETKRGKHDKRGIKNPKWRGGIIEDGHGRTLIYSPGHPNPSYCGTHVYRYRLVMEKHLGRFLLSSEIVHHKNGDKSDDRLDNLEVMTQADHARLHFKGRKKDAKGKLL